MSEQSRESNASGTDFNSVSPRRSIPTEPFRRPNSLAREAEGQPAAENAVGALRAL